MVNSKRKELIRDMLIYYFGLLLVCSAHYSLLHLQSSLNVQDGLGVASVTANYAAVLFGGIFLSSNFLYFLDMKTGIVVTDATYLFFVAANFYPEFYTLVPASIIAGFGKILFWVSAGAFNVYFAKALAVTGSKDLNNYVSTVTACNICTFQLSTIAGNLISFGVFSSAGETTSNISANGTESVLVLADVCGANDCQDPNITSQLLSQYKPADEMILYIVLGVFVALNGIGLLLHLVFAPLSTKRYTAPPNMKLKEEINHNYVDDEDIKQKQHEVETTESEDSDSDVHDENNKFTFKSAWLELKGSIRQYGSLVQLLLIPVFFQVGFFNGFSSSEITRAYASCVFGVSQVGISMAITAAFATVSSLISGKVCSRFGRQFPIAVSCTMNVALLTYCLLWRPSDESTVWELYPMNAMQGISTGCAMTATQVAVVGFFPQNTHRAFSVWATTSSTGALVQFAWSTSLCVHDKIYIMYGVTAFAAITYVLAEIVLRKSKKCDVESEIRCQVTAL
ncbi:protein unc-93 homolog A-like [Ciona intestinalis]